jgi:hypothetical protein
MKVKESKAAAREKRSQEQIDADNEANKKRMKVTRENKSQEQKVADRVGLEFIHDYHRSYDPLQYPLLFPDGQDGWHFDLHHTLLQHVNYITTYASKR